ncbi:MAG: hypothetical protein WCI51_01615 [Lentisphaerota bacterium]
MLKVNDEINRPKKNQFFFMDNNFLQLNFYMKRFLALAAILATIISTNAAEWQAPGMDILPESNQEPISEAKWIWCKPQSGDIGLSKQCFMRLKIIIDCPVKSANLRVCIDPRGKYFVNGQKLTLSPYAPEQKLRRSPIAGEADIASLLKKGENIIAIDAVGMERIILRGNIELDSGKSISLASTSALNGSDKVSGNSWMFPGFDDSSWTSVKELGDVRLWPQCDYNNMAAIFCTEVEYEKYIKFIKEQPLPPNLNKETDARPKIVYHGIIPGIEINGKILSPFVFEVEAYITPEQDDIVRKMYLSGCRIFSIVIQPSRFRLQNGEFDFSEVGYCIQRILALAPDSYIMFNYGGWERYTYFLDKNPDEATGYAVAATIPNTYYDTTFAPSFASQKFRGEVRRVFGELGKFCRMQSWYKRIIGAHSGFGQSGDGMPWGSHCMPDTGKRMTEVFREFLRKKYETDSALQKAWGDHKITLDTARVPDAKERWGQGYYLHDPANPVDCRVIDYYTCYHEVFSDYIIELGKSIKEALPNRLAGVYYGYMLLSYTPEGYTANFERVLASPYIDYMRATVKKMEDRKGEAGAILPRNLASTFHRYGKLSSLEADIHPHKTPEENIARLRQYLSNSLLFGYGVHFIDFGHETRWFNRPEKLTTIYQGIKIWKQIFDEAPVPASDIAAIIDPKALTRQGYPDMRMTNPLTNAMTVNVLEPLSFSGLTYDFLSPEDYLTSTHDYKGVVFLNSYSVNGELRKALLAKLRRPGHLAVWNYAPGIISENGFSDESMSELTGLGLKAEYDKLPFEFKLLDSGKRIGADAKISPRVYCNDSSAEVLGRYVDDQTPALVRKHLADGSTAVFAGVPVSDPDLWGKLLSPPCHAYSLPGIIVRTNSKLLQIHVLKGGVYPIRLPHVAAKVTDLFTGKTIASDTDNFELKADTPFTWLLEVKTDVHGR